MANSHAVFYAIHGALYMGRLWIFKYLKLTFPWFYAIIYARFIYTLGGNTCPGAEGWKNEARTL